MLMKGSKIKMVKRVPGTFFSDDMVFTVDEIIENATITFSCNLGHGIMSYQEFITYFEEVKEDIQPKEEWSEWTRYYPGYDDGFVVTCRQKGRMIQVQIWEDTGDKSEKSFSVKSISKCSPYDEFDFNKGFDLAYARAFLKWANKRIAMPAKEKEF